MDVLIGNTSLGRVCQVHRVLNFIREPKEKIIEGRLCVFNIKTFFKLHCPQTLFLKSRSWEFTSELEDDYLNSYNIPTTSSFLNWNTRGVTKDEIKGKRSALDVSKVYVIVLQKQTRLSEETESSLLLEAYTRLIGFTTHSPNDLCFACSTQRFRCSSVDGWGTGDKGWWQRWVLRRKEEAGGGWLLL